MNHLADKGWKHYLFRKRYPAWVYTVVLGAAAIILYIWLRHMTAF